MSKESKPQRRWMKSVLRTSTEALPDMPFKRGQRGGRAPAAAPRLLRSA